MMATCAAHPPLSAAERQAALYEQLHIVREQSIAVLEQITAAGTRVRDYHRQQEEQGWWNWPSDGAFWAILVERQTLLTEHVALVRERLAIYAALRALRIGEAGEDRAS